MLLKYIYRVGRVKILANGSPANTQTRWVQCRVRWLQALTHTVTHTRRAYTLIHTLTHVHTQDTQYTHWHTRTDTLRIHTHTHTHTLLASSYPHPEKPTSSWTQKRRNQFIQQKRNNAPKAWCPPILCYWTGKSFGGQQSDRAPLTPSRCKSGKQKRAKRMAQADRIHCYLILAIYDGQGRFSFYSLHVLGGPRRSFLLIGWLSCGWPKELSLRWSLNLRHLARWEAWKEPGFCCW